VTGDVDAHLAQLEKTLLSRTATPITHASPLEDGHLHLGLSRVHSFVAPLPRRWAAVYGCAAAIAMIALSSALLTFRKPTQRDWPVAQAPVPMPVSSSRLPDDQHAASLPVSHRITSAAARFRKQKALGSTRALQSASATSSARKRQHIVDPRSLAYVSEPALLYDPALTLSQTPRVHLIMQDSRHDCQPAPPRHVHFVRRLARAVIRSFKSSSTDASLAQDRSRSRAQSSEQLRSTSATPHRTATGMGSTK
jgi:hypothetical protein